MDKLKESEDAFNKAISENGNVKAINDSNKSEDVKSEHDVKSDHDIEKDDYVKSKSDVNMETDSFIPNFEINLPVFGTQIAGPSRNNSTDSPDDMYLNKVYDEASMKSNIGNINLSGDNSVDSDFVKDHTILNSNVTSPFNSVGTPDSGISIHDGDGTNSCIDSTSLNVTEDEDMEDVQNNPVIEMEKESLPQIKNESEANNNNVFVKEDLFEGSVFPSTSKRSRLDSDGVMNFDKLSVQIPPENKATKVSLVDELFRFQTMNISHCSKCAYNNVQYQAAYDYKLYFDTSMQNPESSVTLNKLIQGTFDKQKFECTCKNEGKAYRHFANMNSPKYLVLTLNRFAFDKTSNATKKIMTKVDFEQTVEFPYWDLETLKKHVISTKWDSPINSTKTRLVSDYKSSQDSISSVKSKDRKNTENNNIQGLNVASNSTNNHPKSTMTNEHFLVSPPRSNKEDYYGYGSSDYFLKPLRENPKYANESEKIGDNKGESSTMHSMNVSMEDLSDIECNEKPQFASTGIVNFSDDENKNSEIEFSVGDNGSEKRKRECMEDDSIKSESVDLNKTIGFDENEAEIKPNVVPNIEAMEDASIPNLVDVDSSENSSCNSMYLQNSSGHPDNEVSTSTKLDTEISSTSWNTSTTSANSNGSGMNQLDPITSDSYFISSTSSSTLAPSSSGSQSNELSLLESSSNPNTICNSSLDITPSNILITPPNSSADSVHSFPTAKGKDSDSSGTISASSHMGDTSTFTSSNPETSNNSVTSTNMETSTNTSTSPNLSQDSSPDTSSNDHVDSIVDVAQWQRYALYAVIVHSGASTHSGHYLCFTRGSAQAVANAKKGIR